MNAIRKRLCKIENQLGVGSGIEHKLWVIIMAGQELAIDTDSCIEILRECDFLPSARFGVVNLGVIPEGLNANDTERFLRERGAETCHRTGTR
jgi:hypothetical protein